MTADIHVVDEDIDAQGTGKLRAYEAISIAFVVESRFRVELERAGLGGVRLIEERVAQPYVKDYDAAPSERPTAWPQRVDISNWHFVTAFAGEERVGAAAIAWKTDGVHMLSGADDIAVLWDIRVAPSFRGRGVGASLFARAVQWCRQRECRRLLVETQNVNVPACTFYVRQGCALAAVDLHAYPELPNEVQLIWGLDL